MCFFSSSSKIPSIPQVSAPQTPASEQATYASTRAANTQKQKAAAMGTRRSTLLTGPLGLPGNATTRKKTLLGE